MRKAVFFDLDGTLLPLDIQMFIRLYYEALHDMGIMRRIHSHRGHEIFEKAVYAMIANDGRATNAAVFFDMVDNLSDIGSANLIELMESFYNSGYKRIRESAQAEPRAAAAVKTLQQKGYRLILSTNPLFPGIATDQRVEWAGIAPQAFEYISYYDNSCYCKPNPEYYREILCKTGLKAEECYIVGNDVREDMCAVPLGFEGFLLTDHIIGDISQAPECAKGDYAALLEFVKGLPPV